MDLAHLQLGQDQAAKAYSTLSQAFENSPNAAPLLAPLLAEAAIKSHMQAQALTLLHVVYRQAPSLDVLDAVVTLEASTGTAQHSARDWYVRHLENEPSLVAAAKWIAGEKLEHEQFHPQVQRALDHAVKPLTRYRCAACGFEAKQHFWQCPGCQAWDSYPARRVEEL
jgi:lipopolysaccharide biosynthesis regulator YciM